MAVTDPPPDGFSPLSRTSPFMDAIGPLYCRGNGAEMSLGFRVELKHTNMRGLLHGGVIATLGDVAIGYALATATQTLGQFVTASLSVDFVAAAAVGDWVQTAIDIQKIGSRLAFANAYFHVGERRIARASGVFAAVAPRE